MKKLVFGLMVCVVVFFAVFGYAQDKKCGGAVMLLISEQNIEGPQKAWWASEIDLSTVEAKIAQKLIAAGYSVIEPSNVKEVLTKTPAFRKIDLSEAESVKLADMSNSEFVVLGKAVASSGGNVPQSNMRSCFANVSVKLVRISDGKIIAYLDAAGNSAHLDLISGGREALSFAGEAIAGKIVDALKNERGL